MKNRRFSAVVLYPFGENGSQNTAPHAGLWKTIMRVEEPTPAQWEEIGKALDWTEGVPRAPVEPIVPRQAIQALRDGKAYVYFIGGEGTPVKIGLSNQPFERLAALQTAHWCKLGILAKFEGGLADEKRLHQRFAAHRLHGEWFTRCPEIDAEIARLTALEVAA